MLRKHTLRHTNSQLPSPQEALLDLCSSLEITGPSLPTLSRRAKDTGLLKHQTYEWLCNISQRPLRRSIKRSLFLMAFSHPRLPKAGGMREAAVRRDDADGGEGGAGDGSLEKRWEGIYMCIRAKGKSDQMNQSKCFTLMTSPTESCGAAR